MSSPEPDSGFLSLALILELRQLLMPHISDMPLAPAQIKALSPAAIAYIGDAVYELFIRTCYLFPPQRLQTFHRQVVEQVRAERQAEILAQLTEVLTPAEQEILRRGRNGSSRGPRRLDPLIYQQASSFETLLGYLYLTNPERLAELLRHIQLNNGLVQNGLGQGDKL